MTTKKPAVKPAIKPATPKKRTPLKEAQFHQMIMTEALYMAYDDYDEMFSVLQYILKDLDAESFSKYQVRNALKAIRTLMIHNQSMMMDCAGLEY
jgi:hypothetical protein